MTDDGATRRAPRWTWIILGLVVTFQLSHFIAAAIDGNWWRATASLLQAGFILSGWNLVVDLHSGRFPSNRRHLRHLLISGGFLLAIIAELAAAWIVGRELHWAGAILPIAAGGFYVAVLPRAIREYRKDPDGSYFRQKYDERMAKRTWP